MTDINTSDSPQQPTPPAAASTPAISQSESALWSFTGIELIDASDELTLLLDSASEKRLLVRKEVAIALTHCEAYRTLRGHAEHLVATLPQLGGQADPVVPVLAQIRDAGLLREGATSLGQLTTPVEKTSLAPVQVFIITCDRPAAVERLLKSMASSTAQGLPEAYTLIDDSRDVALAEANRALVEAHNAKQVFRFATLGWKHGSNCLRTLLPQNPAMKTAFGFCWIGSIGATCPPTAYRGP